MSDPALFLDGRVALHAGDCLAVLAAMDDASVDACVTDPPYHLTSIVKRFGAPDAAAAKTGQTGAYARASRGFMGQTWDGGDIAFQVDLWAQVLRVLKPGGHVLAFSGTRTYHRMACAIEDAGFEIRDMTAWLYGSGFPKSHDVAKGLDKASGFWRGRAKGANVAMAGPNYERSDKGEPITDDAQTWEGWGTALKPALEPICLARKPLVGTVAATVLAHGTGALNIDGCRIEGLAGQAYVVKRLKPGATLNAEGGNWRPDGEDSELYHGRTKDGRWPANVVHDGSAEVLAAFPTAPGQRAIVGPQHGPKTSVNIFGDYGPRALTPPRGDSCSAARYFASFPSENEIICCVCNARIVLSSLKTENIPTGSIVRDDAAASQQREVAASARACSPSARDAGVYSSRCHRPSDDTAPSNAETQLLENTVQNVSNAANLCASCATDIARGLVAVRQKGSSVPVRFSRFTCLSREKILTRCLASYVAGRESTDIILTTENLSTLFGCVSLAIADTTNSARSEANTKSESPRLFYSGKADADDRIGSKHPTVKPVDLMRWLVRLVTPPGGTVLDPFAGTGTTGEAAWREGLRAVLIEREAPYREDIARRMALCLAGPDERKRESLKALRDRRRGGRADLQGARQFQGGAGGALDRRADRGGRRGAGPMIGPLLGLAALFLAATVQRRPTALVLAVAAGWLIHG